MFIETSRGLINMALVREISVEAGSFLNDHKPLTCLVFDRNHHVYLSETPEELFSLVEQAGNPLITVDLGDITHGPY